MYSVVAAAKALYEQLSVMGESSIDGDAFLDLWIYVIIKANVKDLVSGSSGGVVAVGEWDWTVLDGAATEPHRLRVCCKIALPMYDITGYYCDSNNIYVYILLHRRDKGTASVHATACPNVTHMNYFGAKRIIFWTA